VTDLLRSDHARSLRDWAIYVTDLTFRASFEMLHTVRTGEQAFPKVFGLGLYEYLAQDPESSENLLRAMSSINAARTAGLLEAYGFGQANWLVDVGGAHGTMVASIAERYPRLRCTTFDRPGAERGASRTTRSRIAATSSEESPPVPPVPMRICFRRS
jgi:hypothetical protein